MEWLLGHGRHEGVRPAGRAFQPEIRDPRGVGARAERVVGGEAAGQRTVNRERVKRLGDALPGSRLGEGRLGAPEIRHEGYGCDLPSPLLVEVRRYVCGVHHLRNGLRAHEGGYLHRGDARSGKGVKYGDLSLRGDELLHALEAVYPLLAPGGWLTVTNTGTPEANIVHARHRDGLDVVLAAAELTSDVHVSMSTEEVDAGKPSPAVYLAVAERLGCEPGRTVGVEDSSNGLRSAASAGLIVVAVPSPTYPPAPDALALADVVLNGIAELTPKLIAGLVRTP